MRNKLTVLIASFAIVTGLTIGFQLSQPVAVQAQAMPATSNQSEERQKQLKEWEASVKEWNEKQANKDASVTTEATMPNAGPADMVVTVIVVGVLAAATFYVFDKLWLNRAVRA